MRWFLLSQLLPCILRGAGFFLSPQKKLSFYCGEGRERRVGVDRELVPAGRAGLGRRNRNLNGLEPAGRALDSRACRRGPLRVEIAQVLAFPAADFASRTLAWIVLHDSLLLPPMAGLLRC